MKRVTGTHLTRSPLWEKAPHERVLQLQVLLLVSNKNCLLAKGIEKLGCRSCDHCYVLFLSVKGEEKLVLFCPCLQGPTFWERSGETACCHGISCIPSMVYYGTIPYHATDSVQYHIVVLGAYLAVMSWY